MGGVSKTYELRALKISILYKSLNFRCMGKIFCVESYLYIEKCAFIGGNFKSS